MTSDSQVHLQKLTINSKLNPMTSWLEYSGIDISSYELREWLHAIKFEQGEVKIECTDHRCMLKDIPIIMKTTGIDTQTQFGSHSTWVKLKLT